MKAKRQDTKLTHCVAQRHILDARPQATKRGQPNTTNRSFQSTSGNSIVEARVEETYPEGTFEALLVIAIDLCKYLQELQDALLVVEIGHLLKRLLNQLTKSFSLKRGQNLEEKGRKLQ